MKRKRTLITLLLTFMLCFVAIFAIACGEAQPIDDNAGNTEQGGSGTGGSGGTTEGGSGTGGSGGTTEGGSGTGGSGGTTEGGSGTGGSGGTTEGGSGTGGSGGATEGGSGTGGSGDTHEHTYGDWVADENNHWKACTGCGDKAQTAVHTSVDGECTVCGYITGSPNVVYALNADKASYSVMGGLFSSNQKVIRIPSSYKGLPVTEIADGVFYDQFEWITDISLPDTITKIGYLAFTACFSLKTINIPTNVAEIGMAPFGGCPALEISVSPENEHYYMAGKCLIERDTKTLITGFKDSVIPADGSVETIGMGAFVNCMGLTSIVIPDSVKTINVQAFVDCPNLTRVVIGSGVTTIKSEAFNRCYNLVEIYNRSSLPISAGSTSYGYIGSYAKNIYTPTSGASKITTTDDGYMFYNDNDEYYLMNYAGTDRNLVLPDSINGKTYAIYENAFKESPYLTDANSTILSVVIPDGVTAIGAYAFDSCSNLTSVTLGNGLLEIGESAFWYCEFISSIIIPDSVTHIGSRAFYDCSKLVSITVGSGVETIDDYAFTYCLNLIEVYNRSDLDIVAKSSDNGGIAYYAKNVYTPTSSESKIITSNGYTFFNDEDEYYLMSYNGSDKELVLPEKVNGNVYSIKAYAFYYNTNITSVVIPDGVTSLGYRAFANCTALTSITLPNSIKSIGTDAFMDCTALTDIALPNGLSTIQDGTFSNCTSLKSVTIPNSVMFIGVSVFRGCTSLESVALPNSVILIGRTAFGWCGLKSITLPSSVTIIEGYDMDSYGHSGAFNGCDKIETISVAQGNTVYKSAGNCLIDIENKMLMLGCKNSVIPSDGSVIIIGENAFRNCSGLMSITIPNSVTTIGSGAFGSCVNLTSVTIPNGVTTIGSGAFESCVNLTSVSIPNSVTTIGDMAFSLCVELKSVTLGNGLLSIGEAAFNACVSLEKIELPDKLKTIGDAAFYNCKELTDVVIPASVTEVHGASFIRCDGIKNLTVEEGNTVYKSVQNCIIEIETKTLVVGCSASIIPNDGSVKRIGDEAFAFRLGLKTLVIPDSVLEIGESAFEGCMYLTSVDFGNGVTRIESEAFYCCFSLTSVNIGSSINYIANRVFEMCLNITSITFENTTGWVIMSEYSEEEEILGQINVDDPVANVENLIDSEMEYGTYWARVD